MEITRSEPFREGLPLRTSSPGSCAFAMTLTGQGTPEEGHMFANTRNHQAAIEQAVAPVAIEQLETRALLSASVTLVDGDLIVAGTSSDDQVEFFLNHDGTQVKVDLNGERYSFDRDEVDRLIATVKGGADVVEISDRNGTLDIVLKAVGGDGDDTLIGGDLADKLIGEYGDDFIQGYGGIDRILGEEGQDLLDGGVDVDIILGGLGDDAEFDVNDALDDLDDLDDNDGYIEVRVEEVDEVLADIRQIEEDGESLWDDVEIGRASCRERVQSSVVGGPIKE